MSMPTVLHTVGNFSNREKNKVWTSPVLGLLQLWWLIMRNKGFLLITVSHHRWSWKEVRMGTQEGQELMHRWWRDEVYWLPFYGLLSLISSKAQDHQARDGTIHNGGFLSHRSLRKCHTSFLQAETHGIIFEIMVSPLRWLELISSPHKTIQQNNQIKMYRKVTGVILVMAAGQCM